MEFTLEYSLRLSVSNLSSNKIYEIILEYGITFMWSLPFDMEFIFEYGICKNIAYIPGFINYPVSKPCVFIQCRPDQTS